MAKRLLSPERPPSSCAYATRPARRAAWWRRSSKYNVSDQAERAVQVLERARATIGDSDAGLALTAEAAIALAGLRNDRAAPTALCRAEQLRGRLKTLADPPMLMLVTLAHHAARSNRAEEAQELSERALACDSYPSQLEPLRPADRTSACHAHSHRALRHSAVPVRGPACSSASTGRASGAHLDLSVPGIGVVRLWRVGRSGGRRALGAGARTRGPPDPRCQRADRGARRARRAR